MTTATIISYADIQPAISVRQPDPEMRVTGAPQRTTFSYFVDPSFGLSSGIWSAETGAYKISMAASKHEFFHILTGKVKISCDSSGAVKSFGPGDTGIIPPGFTGVFEIVETASKFYVVTDRDI
jgi:uncharacterized cupin superfamily protein